MRINYQFMTKNESGRYFPDFDKLMETATCEKEKEYIEYIKNHKIFWEDGFTYNLLYIMQMSCGHYEHFQTPCNMYNTFEKDMQIAKIHSKEKCTFCDLGYSWDV